jgi:phage-related protein
VGKVASAFSSARDKVTEWMGIIKGWVEEKVAAVVGAFYTVLSGIVGKVTEAFNSAKTEVGERITAIKGYVEEKVGAVVSAFGSIISKVKGIGGDIVNGLWDGISGAWGWVMDKVRGLTDKLPAIVKKALGISSPSKVFADIGAQMGAGLVEGMQGMRADVSASVVGMATAPLADGPNPLGLTTPSSSSSRSVVVQRGAVQVNISGAAAGDSTGIRQVVQLAVEDALTALLREARAV